MTDPTLHRRRIVQVLAALGALPSLVLAQGGWPNRPIKVVVPFPAGGALDTVARALSEPMQQRLGQSMVIDNKPGAGARLGTEVAAKSPGDGYTLLVATPSSTSVALALVPGLTYDPMKDLVPVANLAEIINVIVVPAPRPYRNVAEFVTWARQQNRPITFGTSGVGSADHLGGEMFKLKTGLPMEHVPYKGGGLAMADLATERLDVAFATQAAAGPMVASGKVRAIAVTTPTRSKLLPDLPAVSETVPGFGMSNWAGMFLPKGTPDSIRDRLFKEFAEVANMPAVRETIARGGMEVKVSQSPQEFSRQLHEETKVWTALVKALDLKPE